MDWMDGGKVVFRLKEFTFVTVAGKTFQVRLSPVGYHLLDTLVTGVLIPLRRFYSKPIHVTCGARDLNVYMAMVQDREKHPEKPKPSKSSDHFYCNSANPFGSGAADITFNGIDPLDVLAWAMSTKAPTGQVIAYPANGFVHLSNPRTALLSEGASGALPEKPKYLVWTREHGYREVG